MSKGPSVPYQQSVLGKTHLRIVTSLESGDVLQSWVVASEAASGLSSEPALRPTGNQGSALLT